MTWFHSQDAEGRPTHQAVPLRRLPPPEAPPVAVAWLVGLDLGQAQDYAAWAAVERQQAAEAPAHYSVRQLHRWPLGTKYPAIVADATARMARPPLGPEGELILDQTGCGRPVFDLFAQEPTLHGRLVGISITAGLDTVQAEWGQWHVPKVTLIGALQIVLQTRRLHVAERDPHAATLLGELEGYQTRITAAAHVQYGQWREGEHDDILLATALAVWRGEHRVGPSHVY
jgi:hypothetical protein